MKHTMKWNDPLGACQLRAASNRMLWFGLILILIHASCATNDTQCRSGSLLGSWTEDSKMLERLAKEFREAQPFPNTVIPNFFKDVSPSPPVNLLFNLVPIVFAKLKMIHTGFPPQTSGRSFADRPVVPCTQRTSFARMEGRRMARL